MEITDIELRNQLFARGVSVGPLTSSTRKVYLGHLEKLKKEVPFNVDDLIGRSY